MEKKFFTFQKKLDIIHSERDYFKKQVVNTNKASQGLGRKRRGDESDSRK